MLLKIRVYANTNIPCCEVQNIVKKHLGFEKIVETVLEKMGDVNQIFLIGDNAKGIDSNMVEILIIGNKFNVEYIKGIEKKLSKILNKNVVIMTSSSSQSSMKKLLVFSS